MTEAAGLKVVSVGRAGKRRYDRQTKQKLVEACLEPGASIAGLALKHGANANLLHKWIRLHQRRLASTPVQPAPVATAFVPVVEIDSRKPVVEREAVRAQRHDAGAQTRIRTIGAIDRADAQWRDAEVRMQRQRCVAAIGNDRNAGTVRCSG